MPRTTARPATEARPTPAARPGAVARPEVVARPGTVTRPAAAAAPAAAEPAAVAVPRTFDAVLAKAAAKDKANIQRHLDALDAEGSLGHAKAWKKIVTTLARLAPHSLETVGKDAIRFYVADGRYRLQRFAVEDVRDGQIKVYVRDVLERALKKKVLTAGKVPGEYGIPGHAGEVVRIDPLDSDNTAEPAAHFKFMIGMGRKALRLTVAATGHPHQLAVAEQLCELSAADA